MNLLTTKYAEFSKRREPIEKTLVFLSLCMYEGISIHGTLSPFENFTGFMLFVLVD